MELLKKLSERFWYLRGASTAIATLALAPDYFDLSRWQFAKGVWSLIYGWNLLAGKIAEWLNTVFPSLGFSANQINALLLVGSVSVSGYLGFKRLITLTGAEESYAANNWLGAKLFFSVNSVFLYESTQYLLPGETRRSLFNDRFYNNLDVIPAIEIMPIIMFIMAFGLSAAFVKGYFRGVVFVLTFVAVFAAAYHLPIVGDWLEEFSSGVFPESQ